MQNTLDKLKVSQSAKITAVGGADKALRAHLLNMGLTPGVDISLVKTAPLGDPMEFRLRGYELTLRRESAAKISVTNIHKTAPQSEYRAEFGEIEHPNIGENIKYQLDEGKIQVKSKVRFALAGNQNSGKTTLFNKLTGANQHVGNFPGVTVDKVEGILKSDANASITDLPGVYSLSPYSKEEIVTRDFILREKPDAIINIVDATNVERNLLLTTQLIELNVPMVIALNMMDEIKAGNGSIDVNGLENLLGVPVVPISAAKSEGIDELIEHALNIARYAESPKRLDFCEAGEGKSGSLHRCIHSIITQIAERAKIAGLPPRFAASKLVEGDELVRSALNLSPAQAETIERQIALMEEETGLDRVSALADMRFGFIEKLCARFVAKPAESKDYELSKRLDKILTGKYTALPAFAGIMALILYLTFGPVGSYGQDLMEQGIAYVTELVDGALGAWGVNPVFRSLVVDGIFAGVGSVLSFLPVIVTLFFFLSILEDTGYMARVAFFMDKALRKIGLSGRSFVPMLIGFGCSVPAIMATRTLPSERDRKMTIFLIPFMSCSAKLPIYVFFAAAFFAERQILVVVGLYLIGVLVGIIFAYAMKLFAFRGNPVPFVMELPNYRFPSVTNVYRLIYTKAKNFVIKVFKIILLATIVIWFLQTFDARLNVVEDSSVSLLAALGGAFMPLFAPLGIEHWQTSTALITGFMAKESVVSTLSVLLGEGNLGAYFTPLSAFAFLVFCLLYTPCVATIAVVRRELGKLYALAVIALQCAIAWLVAFVVYSVGAALL